MYLDKFITYSCFFKFVYEARQYYAYCEAEEPEEEKAKSILTENVQGGQARQYYGDHFCMHMARQKNQKRKSHLLCPLKMVRAEQTIEDEIIDNNSHNEPIICNYYICTFTLYYCI